jgi:hypothetical protein
MKYDIKGTILRNRNFVEWGSRLHVLHPEILVKVSVGELTSFYTPSAWACKTSEVTGNLCKEHFSV